MAKRIYDPNDPNAVEDDPLGPQEPGSPTSQAPTAARSALLGQMGPDQPLDDPNTPAPQVGPARGGYTKFDPTSGYGYQYDASGNVVGDTGSARSGGYARAVDEPPAGNDGGQDWPGPYTPPDPPPPTPAPQNNAAGSYKVAGTPDQVGAIYAKNHLHPASLQEEEDWLNAVYGDVHSMADIEAQIAASDEAQRARGGGGGAGGGTGDPGAYLLQLLQGGMDRDQAIAQTSQAFGLQQGQDGYPLFYPGNNTIGLHGSYLANVGGKWNQVQRGPEVGNAGAGGFAPSAGSGGGGSPYRTVAPSPYNENLRQWMMDQLGNLSQPIGADSGELAPAISAYNTQSQRDQQLERDQLAEHAYAGGNLDSGSFDTQIRQGIEGAAGKRANFAGSMVFQANTQRKQQLQAMLQTATNAGLMDQAQKIQQAIAEIDAQLRGDQLGFSYADLMARMNRESLLGGMNG